MLPFSLLCLLYSFCLVFYYMFWCYTESSQHWPQQTYCWLQTHQTSLTKHLTDNFFSEQLIEWVFFIYRSYPQYTILLLIFLLLDFWCSTHNYWILFIDWAHIPSSSTLFWGYILGCPSRLLSVDHFGAFWTRWFNCTPLRCYPNYLRERIRVLTRILWSCQK